MTDAEALEAMLKRAKAKFVVDKNQRKIGAPEGSFIIATEHPPDRYHFRTLYMVYHFTPDGQLNDMQVTE